MIDWQSIEQQLAVSTASPVQLAAPTPISGGDIHSAYRVVDQHSGLEYFVKINQAPAYPILQAEHQSLLAIQAANKITSPQPLFCGVNQSNSFLVMEYLALSSEGDDYRLGQQLAQLHRYTVQQTARPYGFEHDNFIGLTPQTNIWAARWVDFWIEQRIKPQYLLAYRHGFKQALQLEEARLLQAIHSQLHHHNPPAVLLHGDLWGGNKGFVAQQPAIFDPACYYGDRETDLAMTELFGGFSSEFYRGYYALWPIDPGYRQRKSIYSLYHVLNHLNLFGSAYLRQSQQLIHTICAECDQ